MKVTTDEGTWLSLDVSPDGRTIVFEMVGDIYTLPIAGGQATRITDGPAFDVQPRFSPDGKQIVFVSDRNGSDNLWVMDANGKNPKAISKGDKTQYVSPEWTPDGKFIVVSRNSAQFAPMYDLYLYHKDGGAGLKMTGTAPAPSGPPNPFAPPPPNNYVGAAFGKDGRYLYVAARQGAGGYNQTSFGWQIAVYDRETGQIFARTDALGGAMRPVISPDGKWMVYGSRADSVTSLRVRDLATGDERWLVQNVQRDDQESRFTRDLLPGSAFTPDGQSLITSYGGKLWRVDIASGRSVQIPFTAAIDIGMGPLSKFEYQLNDTTLTVQQIRGARPSPDGKRLAFTALDKVWVMDLPRGTPRRLTSTTRGLGEHSPVWSPDGRYIAYVTWTDQGGDVMRIRADGPRAARAPHETAGVLRAAQLLAGRAAPGRGARPASAARRARGVHAESVLGWHRARLAARGGRRRARHHADDLLRLSAFRARQRARLPLRSARRSRLHALRRHGSQGAPQGDGQHGRAAQPARAEPGR